MPILNDTLRAQVERSKRRAQRLTLVEGVAQTLAVFLGLLAVTFILDRWLFLPLAVRVALTVLAWGATAAGVVRFIYRPLRKRWSDIKVAFNVEAAHPELNEELESVIELARPPDRQDRAVQGPHQRTGRPLAPEQGLRHPAQAPRRDQSRPPPTRRCAHRRRPSPRRRAGQMGRQPRLPRRRAGPRPRIRAGQRPRRARPCRDVRRCERPRRAAADVA